MSYLTEKQKKIIKEGLFNSYAVFVKYLGATLNQPNRIQLEIITTDKKRRITIPRDYALNYREQVEGILKEIKKITGKSPIAVDKETAEIIKIED